VLDLEAARTCPCRSSQSTSINPIASAAGPLVTWAGSDVRQPSPSRPPPQARLRSLLAIQTSKPSTKPKSLSQPCTSVCVVSCLSAAAWALSTRPLARTWANSACHAERAASALSPGRAERLPQIAQSLDLVAHEGPNRFEDLGFAGAASASLRHPPEGELVVSMFVDVGDS